MQVKCLTLSISGRPTGLICVAPEWNKVQIAQTSTNRSSAATLPKILIFNLRTLTKPFNLQSMCHNLLILIPRWLNVYIGVLNYTQIILDSSLAIIFEYWKDVSWRNRLWSERLGLFSFCIGNVQKLAYIGAGQACRKERRKRAAAYRTWEKSRFVKFNFWTIDVGLKNIFRKNVLFGPLNEISSRYSEKGIFFSYLFEASELTFNIHEQPWAFFLTVYD